MISVSKEDIKNIAIIENLNEIKINMLLFHIDFEWINNEFVFKPIPNKTLEKMIDEYVNGELITRAYVGNFSEEYLKILGDYDQQVRYFGAIEALLSGKGLLLEEECKMWMAWPQYIKAYDAVNGKNALLVYLQNLLVINYDEQDVKSIIGHFNNILNLKK